MRFIGLRLDETTLLESLEEYVASFVRCSACHSCNTTLQGDVVVCRACVAAQWCVVGIWCLRPECALHKLPKDVMKIILAMCFGCWST